MAISASKSQVPSVRYSYPRPTGGVRLDIVSKAPVSESTAVADSDGCNLTRCWVVLVPAVSA